MHFYLLPLVQNATRQLICAFFFPNYYLGKFMVRVELSLIVTVR